MSDLALLVNSHAKSSDLWAGFFGEIERYTSQIKPWNNVYLLTSDDSRLEGLPSNIKVIMYDKRWPYSRQYLKGIKSVSEEFVIIANEDCVPCGDIRCDIIYKSIELLRSTLFSYVKLARGNEEVTATTYANYYEISRKSENLFTQQVAIWKRETLSKIYELSPISYIGRTGGEQQEVLGTSVARDIGLIGLHYFEGHESKRGLYHYESSCFPHIATALVGGKWNMQEYPEEIERFCSRYNISRDKRGDFYWK